jgi:methionine-R-sulfoxide reductase
MSGKRPEQEWRLLLTPMQFHVLRERGTERAFSGKYWDSEEPGTYRCAGCKAPLFTSSTKYHSGCGWPSFTEALRSDAVEERSDTSHGMVRTEVVCRSCGGHLGHVFDDGPPPNGLRYCINGAALDFEPGPQTAGTR